MIAKCLIFVIVMIFFSFSELWFLYIFFLKRYLFQKKKTFSKLKKQVKEFYKYISMVKRNKILPSAVMNKFLEEKKGKYQNFIYNIIVFGIVLLIYAIVCSSLIVMVLFYVGKHIFLVCLVVLAAEVSVFYENFERYIDKYVEWLDEFILFLFQFGIKLSKEKNKEINTDTKINYIVDWRALIISIAVIITMLLLLKKFNIDGQGIFGIDYKQAPFITVVLAGMAVVCMTVQCFKENISRKKYEITYDSKLTLWENDIEKICDKLHIKDVDIKVVEDIADEAVTSILKRNEVPQIRIGGFFLENLKKHYSGETFYYMVLFIFGHELSHISSKDSLNKGKFRLYRFVTLGYLAFCFFFVKINLFIHNATGTTSSTTVVSLVMLAVGLCSYFVINKAWFDERFWRQVNELRADRVGLQVTSVSFDIFKSLMCYYQTELTTEDDLHPLYETRIREIEKYKDLKWRMKDYLRYTWKFTWNLTFRKDWRL